MRLAPALIAFAALTFAGAASAQSIAPVSYSPEFQTELDEEIGPREGAYLSETLTRYVQRALARRGAAAGQLSVELQIVDAMPNRPTLQQLSSNPALDSMRSVSIGGADLRAVLRDRSGGVVAEVEHRYYTQNLRDVFIVPNTWTDARRSMQQFANKVADAYVAHASAH